MINFLNIPKKLRCFGQGIAVWTEKISPGIAGRTRSRDLMTSFEQTRQAGSVVVLELGVSAVDLLGAQDVLEFF